MYINMCINSYNIAKYVKYVHLLSNYMCLHIKHILGCSVHVFLCIVFQSCLAHLVLKHATGLYHLQNFSIFHLLILQNGVFTAFGMEISEISDISHRLSSGTKILYLLCGVF